MAGAGRGGCDGGGAEEADDERDGGQGGADTGVTTVEHGVPLCLLTGGRGASGVRVPARAAPAAACPTQLEAYAFVRSYNERRTGRSRGCVIASNGSLNT
ncbi:hypothetical protein GCM10009864_58960 [Streptomyces lunalinharesii]|uniref:Uncharacterized protein n=1 Tax=Streptomyces lunalinharesii TaxID=333384 RepID=A0ABP6EY67_9ACTN